MVETFTKRSWCDVTVCMLGCWCSHGWWFCCALWLCADGSGVGLHGGPGLGLFILVGWDRSFHLLLGPPGLFRFLWCCLTDRGSTSVVRRVVSVEPSSLLDLFVNRGGSLAGCRLCVCATSVARVGLRARKAGLGAPVVHW